MLWKNEQKNFFFSLDEAPQKPFSKQNSTMFTSQLILEEENELRKLLITEQIDHNDNPAYISQNNSLFDL